MIQIKREEYRIRNDYIDVIKNRMVQETSKTNVNPQFMFKQSFTGITLKSFIGNWDKKGFWVSKFRMQLLEIRPDIIAKFKFSDDSEESILSIRYSIGFSNLLIGLVWIVLFSLPFSVFGIVGYMLGILAMIGVYIVLSINELDNIKKKIIEKIMSNVARKLLDTNE